MNKPSPIVRNKVREKLARDEVVASMTARLIRGIEVAQIAATAGFDSLYVDLEHGPLTIDVTGQICLAALAVGVTPFVRVPAIAPEFVGRVLDAGALGIIAPHVENAEQARAVVRACKFAPEGERSAAGNWPHVGYRPGSDARALRQAFNAATTVVVMLESPEAVARADEIAAVPGVDILHIGTVDLCDALGRPAEYGHPEVMACHERVIRACQRHGKVAGAGGLAHTPALVRQVVGMGARFVTAGVEWDLMMAGVRQRVSGLREVFDSLDDNQ